MGQSSEGKRFVNQLSTLGAGWLVFELLVDFNVPGTNSLKLWAIIRLFGPLQSWLIPQRPNPRWYEFKIVLFVEV